jgi:hypothetical protein
MPVIPFRNVPVEYYGHITEWYYGHSADSANLLWVVAWHFMIRNPRNGVGHFLITPAEVTEKCRHVFTRFADKKCNKNDKNIFPPNLGQLTVNGNNTPSIIFKVCL